MSPDDPENSGGTLSVPEGLALAMSIHRLGRLQEAVEFYERILQEAPDNPDALQFLGVACHQLGRRGEAIDRIRRSIVLRPDNPDAHNNLGIVLKEQGRRAEADAAFRSAIRLAPGHADALNNLGTLLKGEGRLEEAEEAYRRAIASRPDHAGAYHNLGNLLYRLNRLADAIDAHRWAVALSPDRGIAYQGLCASLNSAGRSAEATAVLREWLSFEPGNPIALHLLAACSKQNVPDRAPDDYVREHFDESAGSFEERLRELDYRGPSLIAGALAGAGLPPDGRLDVLDAGCGTGLCAAELKLYARRLSGVDLSPGMLSRARARSIYDALFTAELTAFLSANPGAYDLIVATDTLNYFGDLRPVFVASAAALRAGGRLVFTVASATGAEAPEGFLLKHHGRYSHTRACVEHHLAGAGFAVLSNTQATLRMERGEPVAGEVVVAGLDRAPPRVRGSSPAR